MDAFVECSNCQKKAKARIVKLQHKDYKTIEPPRSWFYIWPENKTKHTGSAFACSLWCSRDVMIDMSGRVGKTTYSWCEQTKKQDSYKVKE